MTKIAVFGAGSWGTAFSIVLADAGNDVTIWGRREEVCATINERRENTDYLPGIELPPVVSATHDAEKAVDGAEVVVLAVPSQTLRANLIEWAPVLPSGAVLVSLMKGVELGSLKRMSEVVAEVTGAGPERIAVVSGPNLSHEIARREPAASVVACTDEDVVQQLQAIVHSPTFRPYTSVDVVGCELGEVVEPLPALRRQHVDPVADEVVGKVRQFGELLVEGADEPRRTAQVDPHERGRAHGLAALERNDGRPEAGGAELDVGVEVRTGERCDGTVTLVQRHDLRWLGQLDDTHRGTERSGTLRRAVLAAVGDDDDVELSRLGPVEQAPQTTLDHVLLVVRRDDDGRNRTLVAVLGHRGQRSA